MSQPTPNPPAPELFAVLRNRALDRMIDRACQIVDRALAESPRRKTA